LTITDQNIPFAKEVIEKLQKANLRVELDDQSESMGKKVKDALNEKVNYIITIGDKEVEKKMLAVRDRSGKTSFDVDITEFIQKLVDEIKERVV